MGTDNLSLLIETAINETILKYTKSEEKEAKKYLNSLPKENKEKLFATFNSFFKENKEWFIDFYRNGYDIDTSDFHEYFCDHFFEINYSLFMYLVEEWCDKNYEPSWAEDDDNY